MRRYADPVEVRKGLIGWLDPGDETLEGPEQFLWRGRLWKVRAVVAHWVETGPWWQSVDARAAIGTAEESGSGFGSGDLMLERELWRVEAGRGALSGDGGVFDLSFDWTDGRWQLVGCQD